MEANELKKNGLRSMEIHDTCLLNIKDGLGEVMILRVYNGWIYNYAYGKDFQGASVFVPEYSEVNADVKQS